MNNLEQKLSPVEQLKQTFGENFGDYFDSYFQHLKTEIQKSTDNDEHFTSVTCQNLCHYCDLSSNVATKLQKGLFVSKLEAKDLETATILICFGIGDANLDKFKDEQNIGMLYTLYRTAKDMQA